MTKSTLLRIALVIISVCLTVLCLELAVRIHRGQIPQFLFWAAESQNRVGRMVYHSRLGWVPRPGQVGTTWISNIDESGIRSNGRLPLTGDRPILLVGDSFTFGDEVGDSETWSSHLERILDKPVLNAGVGAYGIDQAYLRAELLLDKYDPDVVLLSFISDDINRTEYSYYPYGKGWKPYFEYENSSLVLRNVPVPRGPPPQRDTDNFQTFRRIMKHSFLANAVFIRIAPKWWRGPIERIHHDGENVSVELVVRLDSLTESREAQFIVVAFATNGRIGNNARLPNFVKRLKKRGVEVLDLSTMEILEDIQSDQLKNLFQPGGHYSPAMNRLVAESIAIFLREKGIQSSGEQFEIIP